MAGSNLGIGSGERGLSLFPSRPIAGTTARTYTYDLVADFGAAPGNIAATTAALQAFHAEAQRRTRPPEGPYAGHPGHYADADKDHMIILNIPAGTFPYTYNKFTRGIRKLKLIGAGSGSTSLQCTSSASYFDCLPHWGPWDYFGEFFSEDSDEYGGFLNHGYFIDTVSAGATRVTLKNDPANASKFFPGRWVLIFSYSQQQYGYPVSARYHDWAICTSVNPSTGVITFDEPLFWTHRNDRPYWGTTLEEQNRTTAFLTHGAVGPARIAHIDHPDKPIATDHEYRGFTVIANPNYASVPSVPTPEFQHYVWRCRGINVYMDDVQIPNHAMEHSLCRRVHLNNCGWRYDESDKVVQTTIYENCDVNFQTRNHSGQRLFHVIGGRVAYAKIACLEARFENCTIDNMTSGRNFDDGVSLEGSHGAVNLVTCDGVTFKGAGNANARPISPANIDQGNGAFTIGTGEAALTLPLGDGTSRIRVNKGGDFYSGTFARIIDNWGDGFSVRKNGSFVAGASVALIWGDRNYAYVDFDAVTFNAGDTVKVFRVQQVVVRNCNGDNTGRNWNSPPSFLVNTVPQVIWTNNQGS